MSNSVRIYILVQGSLFSVSMEQYMHLVIQFGCLTKSYDFLSNKFCIMKFACWYLCVKNSSALGLKFSVMFWQNFVKAGEGISSLSRFSKSYNVEFSSYWDFMWNQFQILIQ